METLKLYLVNIFVLLQQTNKFKIHLTHSRNRKFIWPPKDTVQILHKTKKGAYMNALEKYCIYKICQQGNHLNDLFSDIKNPICSIISQQLLHLEEKLLLTSTHYLTFPISHHFLTDYIATRISIPLHLYFSPGTQNMTPSTHSK